MSHPITRRALGRGLAAGAGALALPRIARAADPIRLRVSLDTAPAHARNVAAGDDP